MTDWFDFKRFGLFVLTTFFFLGLEFFIHEVTHQTINEEFGVKSSIHLGDFKSSVAYVQFDEPVKKEDEKFLMGLHALNESFGYQFSILIVLALLILFQRR